MKSTTEKLFNKANETFNNKKCSVGIRWGECLWNTVEEYAKNNDNELYDLLYSWRGGENDCFFDDKKTTNFIESLDRFFKE